MYPFHLEEKETCHELEMTISRLNPTMPAKHATGRGTIKMSWNVEY
jgi:hypothetical protein